MRVLRAEHLGFCFGVKEAIDLAHRTTRRAGQACSLGPLIHNEQAVTRLAQSGLRVIDSPDEVENGPVLIRAHGVDPTTMEQVRARGAEVVDATCVLVRQAQRVVRRLHAEGYAVVLIGDANHPEVKGIIGYAPGVRVVGSPEELDRLPRSPRLGIVAQTTLAHDKFAAMVGHLLAGPFREVKIINTLCKEVDRRMEAAVALCSHVDVMFVLGGLHSANTRALAEACRGQGVPAYHVEDWSSFRMEYVQGHRVAGVTAGASTPAWVIDEFIENMARLEVEALNEGT